MLVPTLAGLQTNRELSSFVTHSIRCSGKVFDAEKMVAQSGWYHRHCFRCFLCSQPVDSTSVCDGPDDKIYCRVCYGRIRWD